MDWKARFSETLLAEGTREFSIRSDGTIVCHGPGREAEQAVLQARLNLASRVNTKPRAWPALKADLQALSASDRNRLVTAAQAWADTQEDPVISGLPNLQLVATWLRTNPDGAKRLVPPVNVAGDEPE